MHPPLQRKFACQPHQPQHPHQRSRGPPQSGRFGHPPPRNQFNQQSMQGNRPFRHNTSRGSYQGGNAHQRSPNPWGSKPSYSSASGQFQQQPLFTTPRVEGPPRLLGTPAFNPAIPPPMFQNPQVANMPPPTDLSQIPPLMPPVAYQDTTPQQHVRGFSARHVGSSVPPLTNTSQSDGSSQVHNVYSARETGVPPPWQLRIPPPPPTWLTNPHPTPSSTAQQAGGTPHPLPTQPSTSVSNQPFPLMGMPLFNTRPPLLPATATSAPATTSLAQVAATWICQPPPPPPPAGKKHATSSKQPDSASPVQANPPTTWNTQVLWGHASLKSSPQTASQFPTPIFPPPPVPPPLFHPRMMQPFSGVQASTGGQNPSQPISEVNRAGTHFTNN